MSALLSRQLLLFLVVGGLQLLVDWSVFVGLTLAGVPIAPANLLGRALAAVLGFWLNGRYTFADGVQARLDGRHKLRFLIAWLLLTMLSTGALSMVEAQAGLQMAWLAKPMVEAVMAAIGFVVWRQWVFR